MEEGQEDDGSRCDGAQTSRRKKRRMERQVEAGPRADEAMRARQPAGQLENRVERADKRRREGQKRLHSQGRRSVSAAWAGTGRVEEG
jgi:hypothetical protein